MSVKSKNSINVKIKGLDSQLYMRKSVYDSDSDGLLNSDIIKLDTTNFDGNLSNTDDTVQKAMETIDQMVGMGGGEVNTASNIGTSGIGVFAQKAGFDLEFKKLNAASNKVNITDDDVNNKIDIDINAENISITESQISDLQSYLTSISGLNISELVNDLGYITGCAESDPVVGAVSGIVKADGAGNISAAVADSDYASAARGVTNGDLHDHSGGDGAQVDHAELSNIGINSHTDIDTHISSVSNPHGVSKSDIGLSSVDNVQQMPLSYIDTDDTLSADSDSKVPSQQAIKAYVDNITGDVESALDAILGV